MFVNEKEMRKIMVVALLAMLLLSVGAVMCSELSSAEEEPSVEAIDPIEIELDGEKQEVDAYKFNGIVYVVTNDTESEEELGVYGVTSKDLPIPGVAMFLCSISVDEETTYPVTNILSDFADNCSGLTNIVLADTILDFGEGCFKGLDFGTLVVSDDIKDVADLKSSTAYGGDFKKAEDVSSTFDITYHAGEISYPNYKGQEDCQQSIVQGITQSLTASGDMFDYPYFEFSEWAIDGKDDVAFGDSDSLTWLGGVLYVNGSAASIAPSNMSLTAQWEEEDMYGDYSEWTMWATVGIIVVLAILGFAMTGYRFMMGRKA